MKYDLKHRINEAILLLIENNYRVSKQHDFSGELDKKAKTLTILKETDNIAKKHGLDGLTRVQDIAYKRHFFCYFIKKHFDLSYSCIGGMMGKHHATCIHSIKKHHELKGYKTYVDLTNVLKVDLNNFLTSITENFKQG